MRMMMGILSANSQLYHIDTSTQNRYTEDRRYLERRPNMKRKILTLLLAVSLVNASVSPAAADDYTIEMQEDPEIQEYSESQDIVFDEPEYAGENSAVEDETTAADFEEDVTEDIIIEDFSDEAATAGFGEDVTEDAYDYDFSDEAAAGSNEEGVIEDAYDENFASEDETLAEDVDSFIVAEESAGIEANLATDEEGIPIDDVHFPDPVFRNFVEQFDDGSGYLKKAARERLTNLEIEYSNVTSLKGIEYFYNLKKLDCSGNQLTSLNLSKCTALTEVNCYENQIKSLNVSRCTALTKLKASNNQLTSLDVSKCTELESLECSDNKLKSLDVSNCTLLKWLYCENNRLTSLDMSNCTMMLQLFCAGNQLTSLNVSKCTNLGRIHCQNNKLPSLDVSNFTNLNYLDCGSNKLSSLDVSNCKLLETLDCDKNQLSSLDVSHNKSLDFISCTNNKLTSLDLSRCKWVDSLNCSANQLTSLNIRQCTKLKTLYCGDNKLARLDIYNCPALVDAYEEGEKSVGGKKTNYRGSGYEEYEYLEVDNTTWINTNPKHKHTPYISTPAKAATCIKAGNTVEKKCSVCGEVLYAKKTIPALGHRWGKWTTTKEATATTEGKEKRTCSVCGAKDTRAIPKLGKKNNPLTVKSKSPSVKASNLSKNKQTINGSDAFIIKNAQGTISYKKKSGSSDELSINSNTGLITVKKGTQKGTYKLVVTVTAAGNKQYKAGTKTVTVIIKVI